VSKAGHEVLVIGGGLSGLEVAASLRAGGVADIAILESGPWTGGLRWRSTLGPHYPDMGSASPPLGGRSLRWHGVCLRLEAWALSGGAWPQSVAEDLTSEAALPGSYADIEDDLERWAGRTLPGAGGDGQRAFLALVTALGAGAAEAVPRAVRRKEGSRVEAYTPLHACLDPAGAVPPPRILRDHRVLGLRADRNRVTGVRVATGAGTDTIGCRVAVLAAGALENGRLVAQLSGDARSSGALQPQDHLVEGFVVALRAGGEPLAVDEEGFALVRGDAGSRANLFVKLGLPDGGGNRLLDAWVMGEQQASCAPLEFATDGPVWRGLVRPTMSADDKAALTVGRLWLERLWAALEPARPAPRLRFPDFMRAPRTFAEAQAVAAVAPGEPVTYSWPLGTVEHEGGVLPLGGVVDDRGHLVGLAGVVVVGPATFPRLGAANPSLTTLALARRAAAAIAG